MPIHPIGILNNAGQLGSPYSVRDYKGINAEFGTLTDLQLLVKEAHNRNMAVIIDWVANHTAWDNPWITAHPEWYSKDGSGKIIIPPGTNWADVADLDYNNTTMRSFMISAMKYWILKANIDGFRCDYADGVPTDFWKQAIDSLKKIPNRNYILLAEGNGSSLFGAGFGINYSWDFYSQLNNVYNNNPSTTSLFNVQQSEYLNIPTGDAKLRFTTNHDESAWNNSPIVLFKGQAGALSAFVLATFIGGVPLLYNGQEVGRTDKTPFFSKSPINWTLNASTLAAYKRIMTFRQSSNAIKVGSLQIIKDGTAVVFKRIFQTEEVLVLVNPRATSTSYNLATSIANTNWTNALDGTPVALSTTVNLQPYQYLILKN
jgi:glycosidase